MESELSNTVTVVGNYNSVPISITFKVLEDALIVSDALTLFLSSNV